MKIAIVIGHDQDKQGRYSRFLKQTEFIYNSLVANSLENVDVYTRPMANGYKSQMQLLAKVINPKNYDLVIELHFNAFNQKAQGVETIGFKGNGYAEKIGNMLCSKIAHYYEINNRKHKTTEKNGRGYYFTSIIKAPALIIEPFFGDAPGADKFKDTQEYACIINEWLNEIKDI